MVKTTVTILAQNLVPSIQAHITLETTAPIIVICAPESDLCSDCRPFNYHNSKILVNLGIKTSRASYTYFPFAFAIL